MTAAAITLTSTAVEAVVRADRVEALAVEQVAQGWPAASRVNPLSTQLAEWVVFGMAAAAMQLDPALKATVVAVTQARLSGDKPCVVVMVSRALW